MVKLISCQLFYLILLCTDIVGQSPTNADQSGVFGPQPSCACDSLWDAPDAAEVVRILEAATNGSVTIWPGYTISDATIILNAGQTAGGNHCLGLW